MAGDGAGADGHHLHARDVLAHRDRLEFRIEQILGAGEDQRPGLDRGQRLGGVAIESRRGADVVPLIGPGLVDPVIGVERLHDRGLLRLHPGQHVHAVLELGGVHVGRPRRQQVENIAPQPHALFRRRLVIAVLPGRIGHDRLAGRFQHRDAPGRRLRQRHHRHQRVHRIGMADAPLQHLHAAHRGADNRDDMVDAEFFLQQAILRFHHVADGEFRKAHMRLRLRIAGRGRQPVGDRIGADDEIFVGIERLAGADHEIDAVMIARDRRHHQDDVRFFGVQCAVRDIGDREILDRLAAFQSEVAFTKELVRRLLRCMRQSR